MFDYAAARQHMIDSQIRTNDVTDPAILASFRAIPREAFVPVAKRALSYSDVHIETDEGRYIMRPRDYSKLLEAADIASTDIVLDIACGRGYSTAVLAGLCDTVVGLEDSEERVNQATDLLTKAGITNAAVVKGDIKSGAREHGPFDVIAVNGSVSDVPTTWLDQLANGGRLLAIIQDGPIGRATVFNRSGDAVGERVVFDASVPALPSLVRAPEFTF
jgi:protein-L-isoaspartate(D-aspartate) O-methyltransferase